MAAIDADLWVLTETRASVSPGDSYYDVHSPPHLERRPDVDERWVSIWSRWPLQPTQVTSDPRGSVSVVVDSPHGEFVVYGTVLPWANERGVDGQAKMWQVHYEEIERQGQEWMALRAHHPDVPFIVAGDFNQDRDASGWYGTHRGRALLTEALDEAGLTCVSAEDVVATGKLRDSHLVDHIALSKSWVAEASPRLSCWEKVDPDGIRLSDHPTVVVDIRPITSTVATTGRAT